MNLAINQPSQLSHYARDSFDRSYADQHETLLGHLVCERGYELKTAIEDLRPTVKQIHRQTISARDACQKLGLAGIAIGVLVGASPLGIGLGIPPLLAGSLALKFWGDSRSELPKRLAEYHLLKTAPNLPEALWALHLRGANPNTLIGAYDQLVGAIEARLEDGRDFSEGEVAEFLQAKMQSSLETTVTEGDRNALRDEPLSLAQTEVQGDRVTSKPITPSYGIAKNRSPVDILAAALFAHRAFYGGQRTGKSLLASAASLGILKAAPGTKIFYVNLFAFDREETLAMFAHAHRSIVCDLAPITPEDASPYVGQLSGLIEEFKRATGAILILDECPSLGDKFSQHSELLNPVVTELVGYLSAIRDSSKKRRKAVWTIGPGIVANNLTDAVKTLLKSFPPILVAIPKGRSVDWQGQALTTDTTIAGQLKANYPSSNFDAPEMDCDRVCFIDSVWMPLGHLSIPDLPSQSSPQETQKLSQGQLSWELIKVGSPGYPDAKDAIEVSAVVDPRPDGLEEFPMVAIVWDYLHGKEPRTIKQITMALRKSEKISEDELRAKLGAIGSYSDGISSIVNWGTSKGFLISHSDGSYSASTNNN